jgi:hypothetical protein
MWNETVAARNLPQGTEGLVKRLAPVGLSRQQLVSTEHCAIFYKVPSLCS